MKQVIEFIKTLWQNKRTRALAILIIYIIFFVFVFAILNASNNKEEDKFYYLKNINIVNYNVLDNNDNIVMYYDSNLINGEVIYKLVKNSTLESTNYIDNSNTYYISIIDYEKLQNIDVLNDGGIRTTVSDDKIILDFTEYYGYKIILDVRS